MSEKCTLYGILGERNSRYLAEKICASLNCPFGENMNHKPHFCPMVKFCGFIRGVNSWRTRIPGSIHFPKLDNLMELLLMIDAAKRASAKSVVAVIPYFGWGSSGQKRQTTCIHRS